MVRFRMKGANDETSGMIKPSDVELRITSGTSECGWRVKRCDLVALGNELNGQSSQVFAG